MGRVFKITVIFLLVLVFAVGCGSNDKDTDLSENNEINNEQNEDKSIENQDQKENESEKEGNEGDIYNPLTGEMVSKTQNLTAVMVNNHGKARPQTGLIDADIVYEIETEGLITRFFSLFYGDPPEHVGPVRSARPYFMSLAKEWDAYYIHVGGSNEAFALMKKWGIRDIDDTGGHPGFWLDESRERPHNTYINLETALKGKKDNGKLKDLNFVDGYDEVPDYKVIKYSYSKYNNVKYEWDENKNSYLRFINNIKHIDRISGEQITADNIIVQYAKHRYTGDELKHIEVDIIGQGDAEYFLGGKYFKGTWSKKSLSAPTIYYDENGEQIKLVRGKTWVQVVRDNDEIEKIK